MNPSLLREMWRAAASLEHLPVPTKTQLGDELIAKIKKGDFVETGLWCLARLGARKLFYGPINQVLPPSTAARWIDAVIKLPKAEDAVAAMARRTGDASRDSVPRHCSNWYAVRSPKSISTPKPQDQLAAMGKIFGEELPPGLVFHVSRSSLKH